MGNTPSSSPKSSQGHLPEISPIGNSKIALVYRNTPTLIFRPATYREALLEARERFLIPRHEPVELTCQYLTVGYIVVNDSNWESVSPTLHTLFVSSKPTPPIPSHATTTLTPHEQEHEQDSTSHLQISPFQPTGSLSSHQDAETSSTSHTSQPPAAAVSNIGNDGGGGSSLAVSLLPPVATTTTTTTTTAGIARPTSLQPMKKNSHELGTTSPLRPVSLLPNSHTSHSPAVSPSSSRPLPLPPVLRANPPPISNPSTTATTTTTTAASPIITTTAPPPAAPTPAPAPSPPPPPPPRSVYFSVCYSESGDNDSSARGDRILLTLPASTTISQFKDVLSDEFVLPVYSQALWLNQLSIDADENATLSEVGIGDRSHVIVTRA
ncbi:hypothetical protein FRC18_002115 [Serendipita sp. 400]|nr:hypothetical protein FRC18_002115 [Serendipita sp. 400]